MGLFEQLPYTNLSNLNLGEIIKALKEMGIKIDTFTALNKITYRGAWDITTQYPAWSVVVVDGTKGYISIKPVPLGVDYTNYEYWRLIADFTIELSNLGDRVIALENEDIIINGRINTTNNNVGAINNILAHNQISDCQYAIWIGDSYTMAGSLGGDVDKRFSTLVTNWLGLTEKNYGVGSCGFIHGSTPYTTQLTNAINEFETQQLDKSLVKYVFISSCRNDTNYGTRSDIATAVRTLVTTINTEFPNAEIIITPLLWDWKTIYFNSRLLDYISEIQRATFYGHNVRIIDYGYEWLMGTPDAVLYENGGDVHPTVFGHRIIANHIYSAVKGNNWRRYEFVQLNPTSLNGIGDFLCFYEMCDGYVNLNFQFTVNGGSDIATGELWSLSIPSLYFQSFFITDIANNDIYFDIVGRDMTGAIQPCCKALLRNVCARSDQHTGSYKLSVHLYGNGSLINGHKYYARLRIPYGRRNYPTFS